MNDVSAFPSAKVIMLGDTSVGKTSIVLQYYKNMFPEESQPTIGAAYVSKLMETSKGIINLSIWDTAGQERFKSIIPMYLRGCAAACLVCSCDNEQSVTDLSKWKDLLEKHADSTNVNVYVVLNKSDLPEKGCKVAAQEWASSNGYSFIETSAKDRQNIDELFKKIVQDISGTIDFAAAKANSESTVTKKENESKCC